MLVMLGQYDILVSDNPDVYCYMEFGKADGSSSAKLKAAEDINMRWTCAWYWYSLSMYISFCNSVMEVCKAVI